MDEDQASSCTQSFPFMRLPPELRKIVIEKYYEDGWTVSFYRRSRKREWLAASTSPPLLVNRCFYNEMKKTMARSRNGSAEINPVRIVRDFRYQSVVFRNPSLLEAITTVSLSSEIVTVGSLRFCKENFPNLQNIDISRLAYPLWSPLRWWVLLPEFNIPSFMDGGLEKPCSNLIHETVRKALVYPDADIEILGDTNMEWSYSFNPKWYCCGGSDCPLGSMRLEVFIRTTRHKSEILTRELVPQKGYIRWLSIKRAMIHLEELREKKWNFVWASGEVEQSLN